MNVISTVANEALARLAVMAAPQPPQISWVPDAELQVWATRAAFVVALIWIVYFAAQFVIPSNRGRGMGRGGGLKLIGAAIVIVVLMDLKLVPQIINNFLAIVWYLGDLIGLA